MSAPKKPDESELARRLDVARRLPSLARASLVAAALTVAAVFGWPVIHRSGQAAISPGPVSNHHRLIENQCDSCHGTAFRGAPDERCSACHAPKAHTATSSTHDARAATCSSCHREHHGQRSLVPVESPLCTDCHSHIDALAPQTRESRVDSFASHPEFAALATDSASAAKAAHSLKFSHAKHQTATLTCVSCHVASPDGAAMRPITFDAQCASCHSVELDERGAGKRVSHGSPQRAYDAVLAGLAQFYVGRSATVSAGREERYEREARDLERALYTEGNGCMKCHDVKATEALPGKSGYAITPPAIPARWMPASRFSHARHRTTACISCHAGAATSVSAGDVLLPRVTQCRECHADPGVAGKVESPCLECHRYHAN